MGMGMGMGDGGGGSCQEGRPLGGGVCGRLFQLSNRSVFNDDAVGGTSKVTVTANSLGGLLAAWAMDTLGFEPRAFRMRSGCDTTTPCAPEYW